MNGSKQETNNNRKGEVMKAKAWISLMGAVWLLGATNLWAAVFYLNDGFDDGDFTSNPPWDNLIPARTWGVLTDLGNQSLVYTNDAGSADEGFLRTLLRAPANTGSPVTISRGDGLITTDAVVRQGFNNRIELRLRLDANNYYQLSAPGSAGDTWLIAKVVGGVFTLLATAPSPVTPTNQYETSSFKIALDGTLQGLHNGIPILTVSDSSLTSFTELVLETRFALGSIPSVGPMFIDSVSVFQVVPVPEAAVGSYMLLGVAIYSAARSRARRLRVAQS